MDTIAGRVLLALHLQSSIRGIGGRVPGKCEMPANHSADASYSSATRQHNEPGHHEWVGPDGVLAEPLGSDTSPVQHARGLMVRDGENCRCPACGAEVKIDSQSVPGSQIWCDGVNQGLD